MASSFTYDPFGSNGKTPTQLEYLTNNTVDKKMWDGFSTQEQGLIGEGYNNLYGDGLAAGAGGAFTDKLGNFDIGSTVGTLGGVADLFGNLQGLGLFGGDPRLKQQQAQFDKQFGLAQTTMENQRIAAQNQQNRGAATRAAANGGVDNRERYVSSPDYKKPTV